MIYTLKQNGYPEPGGFTAALERLGDVCILVQSDTSWGRMTEMPHKVCHVEWGCFLIMA